MATINGNGLGNKLRGTTLNDTINGLAGADYLYGGLGNDTLNGGTGNDKLYGEVGDDTLNGDANNDALYGGAGADTLNGGLGNDQLFGSTGIDTLNGGDNTDTLTGGAGADAIDGGNGFDTVSYNLSDIKSGVIVDLAAGLGSDGDAQGDTYTSIENVMGSLFDDYIDGNGSANTLNGNGGNDLIQDGAGADLVNGGEGSDVILVTVDGDIDTYDGGTGSGDMLDLSNFGVGMTVILSTTTGTASNGTVTDKVKGFEAVQGTAQANSITGSNFGEKLYGGAGSDTIRSVGGHDRLWGDADSDRFVFQSTDVFSNTLGWLGHDRIMDFDAAGADADIIDISEMLEGIDVTLDADLDLAVTLVEFWRQYLHLVDVRDRQRPGVRLRPRRRHGPCRCVRHAHRRPA